MGFGLDDIGEFFEDIADIPSDLVEAGASLFDGPGGVAGIFVSGGTLFVGGPGALIPAVIAGTAVTEGINALIKTRQLSSEESTLADLVFDGHLPAHESIILTNLGHPQGRAFTIPNAAGECLINLGDAYDDPIRHTSKSYVEYGQLLIHELTHAWQIHRSGFIPGLICEGIINQVQNELEDGIYNPGDAQKAWSEYNLEQQATIVDRWYRLGCSDSADSSYWHHVLDSINDGARPPAVNPLSVRGMAQRKFGTVGSFIVQDHFPGSSSLRRRLIGLKG